MAAQVADAIMLSDWTRGVGLRPGRIRTLGSWLGVFAIAMLFIGPPLGQWRAQQHAAMSAAEKPSAHAAHDHVGHDAHATHGTTPSASGRGHAQHAPGARQLGALTLDHCGYCHLVASFAALPASVGDCPILRWEAQPPTQPVYREPVSPPRHARRARAPPQTHA